MKTVTGVVVSLGMLAVSTGAYAKGSTPEQTRAFEEGSQKCYPLFTPPQGGTPYQQCMEAVFAKMRAMQPPGSRGASTSPRPPGPPNPPASPARIANGNQRVAVYHCNIPALHDSRLGAQITIWRVGDTKRYFVSPRGDSSRAYAVRHTGTPGRGNVGFILEGGASLTVTPSGWVTTSLDETHNKNSLYGPVSSARNLPRGQCSLQRA
ncbi:MAG: hypothetical protein EPN41_10170 [Candidimonas sp.]|nr:MAG: hypothetical protein EPN41_10170 [Candidimonas sp.]